MLHNKHMHALTARSEGIKLWVTDWTKVNTKLVWFSSVPWLTGSSGGYDRQFSRDPLPVFSAGGPCQHFWHERDVRSLMFSIQHFLCRSPHCPPSKVPRRMVLERLNIVVCDTPEPCKFPSLDSCQKRFLWTHKKVDLHPVVGCVFQVGDAAEFPQAVGFESLDPFSWSQQAGTMFHSRRRGWSWQRLVLHGLARQADGAVLQDPV